MTVRLKSRHQSDTVPGLLARNRQWRVSLKFKRGMLLESDGEALFIGGDDASKGPYHLLLPRSQFELLRYWEVGRPVHSQGGRLVSGQMVLESGNGREYSTSVSRLSAAGAEFGLGALEDFARRETMVTGLGFSISQLLNGEEVLPVSPQTLADEGSHDALEKLVGHLAGRGQGLTPSGDDFLVGMMAVLPDCPDLYCLVLLMALEEETTTTVSRCYFRQALQGCFDHDVTLMVTAMNQKWRKALRLVFSRIQAHGYSSGIDLLAGGLFALQILKYKSTIERKIS